MDIRIINKKNEIINASELSIKTMNRFLIGIDAGKNVVEIEDYESVEEAEEKLKEVGEEISKGLVQASILIDLRKKEREK